MRTPTKTRSRTQRITALAAVVVLTATAATTTATTAASATTTPAPAHSLRQSGYRTTLQHDVDAIRRHHAPGVLLQVGTDHGRLNVRSGYGDVRAETSVPTDGHFRIASFTKTFVSATTLKLVGQGKLSLDDTVEKWLPGVVRGHGNDGRKITVRQLLGQTSGLPDYTHQLPWLVLESFFDHRYETVTVPQQVELAMSQQPVFAPGTSWGYSNTNYLLAGMILEKVEGKPWQEVVREQVVRPLHLTNTSFPYASPRIPAPHARGYNRFIPMSSSLEHPVFGKQHDVTELNPSWGGAAGEMISTAKDAGTFLRALLGGRLLKPAQLAEMKRTVPVDAAFDEGWPGARYGLGLMRIPSSHGGFYWEHGGDIQGFMTRNGVSDDGRRSVVVSVNTDSPVPAGPATPGGRDLAHQAIDDALRPAS